MRCLVFDRSDRYLAAAVIAGSPLGPMIWDLKSGHALSPDGKLAASSDFDGKVRLWRLGDAESPQDASENKGARKE